MHKHVQSENEDLEAKLAEADRHISTLQERISVCTWHAYVFSIEHMCNESFFCLLFACMHVCTWPYVCEDDSESEHQCRGCSKTHAHVNTFTQTYMHARIHRTMQKNAGVSVRGTKRSLRTRILSCKRFSARRECTKSRWMWASMYAYARDCMHIFMYYVNILHTNLYVAAYLNVYVYVSISTHTISM